MRVSHEDTMKTASVPIAVLDPERHRASLAALLGVKVNSAAVSARTHVTRCVNDLVNMSSACDELFSEASSDCVASAILQPSHGIGSRYA